MPDAKCEARGTRHETTGRRGSALLIVLGMLAFMIISAVAFSAYMRYTRMPSSYLRRTSASRHLVKAALARAVDEIDAAIGNNPHPGVGTKETRYPRNQENSSSELMHRNIWLHRVYFGTNGWYSVDDTVSPLTLEGLAYIPPPLVNEARYYSRLSPAAAWKTLGFDMGRYAFCALDVSDYFDVNRIFANSPRSSAGNRRVSLSYLFENDSHTSSGTDSKTWDNWMKLFRSVDDDSGELKWSGDSIAPLVSLADFNLALGYKGGIGNMKSPFYEWIKKAAGGQFYDLSGGDSGLARINRMTFVTDGLFPEEDESKLSSDKQSYDLSDPDNQPFEMKTLLKGGSKPRVNDILGQNKRANESDMHWRVRLGGIGMIALYDYLDEDHYPLSLAVPTIERVPMICGIEPFLGMTGMKLGVQKTYEYVLKDSDGTESEQNGDGPNKNNSQTVEAGTTRECEQIVYYRVNAENLIPRTIRGKALVVFPFSKDAEYSKSFKIDGRASFFFSTAQMSLRTTDFNVDGDILHLKDKNAAETGVDANGLMNIEISGDISRNAKTGATSEEDAVEEVQLTFVNPSQLGTALQERFALLKVNYKWTQTATVKDVGYGKKQISWTPKLADVISSDSGNAKYASDLCILNSDGSRNTSVDGLLKAGNSLYLNAAIWLRVKEQSGDKVVDMVPASMLDDATQLDDSTSAEKDLVKGAQRLGETGYPLMRFDTANQGQNAKIETFTISALDTMADNETSSDVTIWPQSVMVGDPRFNHAPENWFAYGGSSSKSTWLTECKASDGDGDIFMEVSDQAYMQSKYELAMLPAVHTLENAGSYNGTENGSIAYLSDYSGRSFPDSFARTAQHAAMWNTYDPAGDDSSAFDDMRFVGDKKGFRINPYSDSTNVIMAAFANTPLNWALTGTNDVEEAKHLDYCDYSNPDAAGFNKLYAWNEYSQGGKFAWADLAGIAGNFMSRVRSSSNWETAWNGMDWYADNFCGVTLSSGTDDLWSVDRKFLYGYWKECFDVKQQLFLIFVRAEPAMMGGGGMGQIPPQLGGRAVALVWRNPKTTKRDGSSLDDDNPHQTRVLFYRQLD